MSAHAKFGPSSADAWMTCLGYTNAVDGLPNDSSEFAAEGTAAHDISDLCLSLGLSPFDFIGTITKIEDYVFEWSDEDAEFLLPGIERTEEFPGTFYGERKVDLSRWLGPDQFGTLDRGIVSDDLIVISDLKYGRGVPVSPVENKQLMLYAVGFWDNVARHVSDAKEFLIIIDQPRCPGGGGEWYTTLHELLAFGDDAQAAALAGREPNAPRVASAKGCYWCRRRKQPPSEPGAVSGCKTYDEYQLAMFGAEFEDLDTGSIRLPDMLSLERRSVVLEHKGVIEKWLEDLHAACLTDALAGLPTPGRKAVAGRRPAKKWNASQIETLDERLTRLLGELRFMQKIKSPTQVSKEISKRDFADLAPLIDQGQPKPILVPEADARPALTPVTDQFDDLP